MKNIILLLAIVFSSNFYSQISFEKGYIIDNNDVKKECLIKNLDWRDNPSKITIKLLDSDIEQVEDLTSIKEFMVDNSAKYVKVTAMMDLFDDDINRLTTNPQLNLKNKTIFLRVIIEGDASLYEYQENTNTNFFYSYNNSKIEQLIFKKYLIDDSSTAAINTGYKIQLSNNIKCETTSFEQIENLNFNKKSLSNYFLSFNICKKNTFKDYRVKSNKGSFNVKLKAGFYSSSFSLILIRQSAENLQFDFESKARFNGGFETEYVLPFNKNKWSIYFEPNFQSYNSKEEFELEPYFGIKQTVKFAVDYKHIDLISGARHYIYLSPKSKIFLNVALKFVLTQNGGIKNVNGKDLDVVDKATLSYGIGYNYNNKFIFEIKQSNYNILDNYKTIDSSYKTTSLQFGYTIFNTFKK